MAFGSALAAQGGVWTGAPAELPTAVLTCTRAACPCWGTVKLLWVVSAAGRVMGCAAGVLLAAGAAAGSAAMASSISDTERPDSQAALTALPVSLKLPPSVGIGAAMEAAGAAGAGAPSGGISFAAIPAARSAGESTTVSPCTRPVMSSCGSCTGVCSGSSSTGISGVSKRGSCGTGVSGVSNSAGSGSSRVVSELTSCGV